MDDPKPHAPRGPLRAPIPKLTRDVAPLPAGARKCRAKRSNGQPCTKWAIRGGVVCDTHGGRAPQVKAKALERLLALQDPAITRLASLIDQEQFPSVAYAAARDVLDRTLGKPAESVQVSTPEDKAFEIVIRKAW